MKKVKALIAGTVLAASTVASSAAMAETSVSANIGYVSDYFFRGIYQTASSASGGRLMLTMVSNMTCTVALPAKFPVSAMTSVTTPTTILMTGIRPTKK